MNNKLNKNTLAYVIGVAIGDGNLSNPNGRATRLRVSCDLKYPNLIKNICENIKEILPNNKVSINKRPGNCCDISCYSNHWEKWLCWKVGLGSKFQQNVSVPGWIKKNKQYTKHCLRGLFQTDGSIYKDRNYKTVMFVTIIEKLAKDVIEMIKNLGFKPQIYRIKLAFPNKDRFNIRIYKEADQFIKTIDLIKD